MAIKLKVKKKQEQAVREIGGHLLPDGETWVIPDGINDINPFMHWLPKAEGHIVQRPYFVVRAQCRCWSCGKDTTVVGLGAKCFQSLTYRTVDKLVWTREEGPLLYTEIDRMDAEIAASLQSNYPFFQRPFSKKLRRKQWGNCCVHCQALQEEDGDYIYDAASPFSPVSPEEAKEIRVIYFKLKFDYYISAGYEFNPLFDSVL